MVIQCAAALHSHASLWVTAYRPSCLQVSWPFAEAQRRGPPAPVQEENAPLPSVTLDTRRGLHQTAACPTGGVCTSNCKGPLHLIHVLFSRALIPL